MAISNRLKKKLDQKRQRDAVVREIMDRHSLRLREIARRALDGVQKGADHGSH